MKDNVETIDVSFSSSTSNGRSARGGDEANAHRLATTCRRLDLAILLVAELETVIKTCSELTMSWAVPRRYPESCPDELPLRGFALFGPESIISYPAT